MGGSRDGVYREVCKLVRGVRDDLFNQLRSALSRETLLVGRGSMLLWQNRSHEIEQLFVYAYHHPESDARDRPLIVRAAINCFSVVCAKSQLQRARWPAVFCDSWHCEITTLPNELAAFGPAIASFVHSHEAEDPRLVKAPPYPSIWWPTTLGLSSYTWTKSAWLLAGTYEHRRNTALAARVASRTARAEHNNDTGKA